MHFYSAPPMHFLSGVDIGGVLLDIRRTDHPGVRPVKDLLHLVLVPERPKVQAIHHFCVSLRAPARERAVKFGVLALPLEVMGVGSFVRISNARVAGRPPLMSAMVKT